MHTRERKFLFVFREKSMRESQVIIDKIKHRIVDQKIFISISIIVLVNDRYTIIC